MNVRRLRAAIAGFVLALTAPAVASAADSSLLSGYGGPGSGEQVVLSSGLVGGGSSGASKGGGSASGTPGAATTTGAVSAADATAAAPLTVTPEHASRTGAKTNPTTGARAKPTRGDGTGAKGSSSTTKAAQPGTPSVPGTPPANGARTRAGDRGSSLPTGDVLVVLAALLGLAAVGAATRGLVKGTAPAAVRLSGAAARMAQARAAARRS